jgi:hypothetical protein
MPNATSAIIVTTVMIGRRMAKSEMNILVGRVRQRMGQTLPSQCVTRRQQADVGTRLHG